MRDTEISHVDKDGRSLYLLQMKAEMKGTGQGPEGTQQLQLGKIVFNVPVSLGASILLWGTAGACFGAPETMVEFFGGLQDSVTWVFTWLYISSNGIWVFFLVAVYWKYGHVKMGKGDEPPEFSDASYFMMIFCAGVGIGLIFYGAAEPMWHYIGGNRYSQSGYLNDNDKAQHAINLTLYHWGVHGWVLYTITAHLMGLMTYKYDFPLTYRTCFFPVFGKATWGWIGDVIDVFTILGSIAGVCTALGLGAGQILTALQYLGAVPKGCPEGVTPDEFAKNKPDGCVGSQCYCSSIEEQINYRVLLVAVITAVSTSSVLMGVHHGVRRLSQIGFLSGMFLMCICFALDNHWYLLNLITQSFGFYIQWIMQLGWFTDAFGQLPWGEGRALDIDPVTKEVMGHGAATWWQNSWTIFYWGWWISWSAFVGMFLARISKNRTIANVTNFVLSVPMIYVVMWFTIFGGASLKMHRRAALLEEAGKSLYNNSEAFMNEENKQWGTGNCFDVPVTLDCPGESFEKNFGKGTVTMKAVEFVEKVDDDGVSTYPGCPSYTGSAYLTDPKLTPVCLFGSGTGFSQEQYWFDLMNHYHGMGGVLSYFSIFSLIAYFAASSDSGSMVVDLISTNGADAHFTQRLYWSLTEGGLAIALLLAGRDKALKALQAVSIVTGVPFTVFVCIICLSLWRVLKYDENPELAYRQWTMPMCEGVFDGLGYVLSCGATKPRFDHVKEFFIALFAAPMTMLKILEKKRTFDEADGAMQNVITLVGFSLSYLGTFIFLILIAVDDMYSSVAFFCYFVFVSILSSVRSSHREKYAIEGGLVEDYLVCAVCFPQVLVQLKLQVDFDPPKEKSLKCSVTSDNKIISVEHDAEKEPANKAGMEAANIGML